MKHYLAGVDGKIGEYEFTINVCFETDKGTHEFNCNERLYRERIKRRLDGGYLPHPCRPCY